MARSEIDDIFAAKRSTTKVIAQPVASTSASTDATGSKKKKKDKKRKRQAEDSGVTSEKPQKKRVIETVHDPSTTLPSAFSSTKAVNPGKGVSTTKLRPAKKEKEDLDRFKDSRGAGSRKQNPSCDIRWWSYRTLGRKTEEGFSIFKEAELGINPEAGGI